MCLHGAVVEDAQVRARMAAMAATIHLHWQWQVQNPKGTALICAWGRMMGNTSLKQLVRPVAPANALAQRIAPSDQLCMKWPNLALHCQPARELPKLHSRAKLCLDLLVFPPVASGTASLGMQGYIKTICCGSLFKGWQHVTKKSSRPSHSLHGDHSHSWQPGNVSRHL